MAKTLRLLPQNLNSYETAHQLLSGSPYYSDDMWLYAARNDQLENYMTALVNDVDISKETLLKDYNYQFGDAETKLAALQNELFADKTTLKTRERIKVDEAGNPILKNGQYQWETYETSDYDYFKSVIKTNNDKLYEDYLKAQEIERKESMSFWAKLGNTAASVPLEAVEGITRFVDDTTALLYATGEWIGSGFEKGSFVKSIASDEARMFENLGFQDWLIDFESRFTWMREIDGSYTSFGQIAGGVANSLGYMLPSMLLTKGVGTVAGKAGSAAIAKAGSIASQSLFYAGMTSGNIKDMYETFAHQGVSVSSSKLVFNSALKSAAQWGIEVGLGKILGSTSLDNLVFGRQISNGVGKDLTSAALKRVGKDFVQEGLEEVLQDTSDFLINKGFSWFIDEDFEHVAEWSLENIAYAFVVGGLASFAGSARNILRTKRVSTGDILVDDAGEIRYDKKGKPVEQKLSKIASWEYGLNMDSFIQNFNEIKREGDRLARLEAQGRITKDSYDFKAYETALKEMYASMRLISSVYNTIGEERFKNADQILTKITERIRSGKWSEKDQFKHIRIASENIVKQVFGSDDGLDLRGANMLNAMERIEKAKLEKVLKEYERNEDGHIELSDETKEGIEGIVAKDKKIRKVVITQDGERPLIVEDVLFAPLEIARTAKGDMIYDTIAEQKLVEDTVAGKYKISLDIVLKTYKEVSGLDNATMDEAIYNLYFNDSFFRIMLQNANRDVYQFLSSLLTIEKNLIPKDFRDETYKSKLKLVTTWMLNALEEYCINQQNAEIELDVFDQARIKRIRAMRWCKDLYVRVITGDAEGNAKYSEQDLTVLSNRINGLKLSKSEKEKLYKQLQSQSPITRMSAMNRIDREYDGVFRTPYNGETYMPTNSLANQIFNNYLIDAGLTIQTVLEQDTLSNDELKAIEGTYGQVNPDTILQYRNEQLSVTCNGRYRFSAVKRDGLWRASIFTADGKQVGYSAYGDNIDKITSGENIDERTFITKGKRNNAEIRKLLRADIDIATASYLSIDDVINNPEYLTDDIQNAIRATYGDLSPDSAFFYMRKYFLDKFKNVTVIVTQDGTYAFGDVSPMLSVLKKGTLEIDEHTKISDLINPKYLLGRAKYLKIELTDDPNVIAQYRYLTKAKVKNVNVSTPDNTLILNRNVLRDDPNLARFAFLHEFQHCIQTETKMNLGLDNGWLFKIPKTLRDKIVADVKQHKPELFEGITDKKQIRQIVNDFVYHTTGESTAYGMDASEKVDFYPTLVAPSSGKLMVTLPWGSKYDLLGNYVSITAKSATTNPMYDEVKRVTGSMTMWYVRGKKDARKGLLLPDGTVGFFAEYGKDVLAYRAYGEMVNTHQWRIEQIVNDCDDYMAAMAYLNDSIEITNTAFVYDKRTNSMEERTAWTKGNGYTVKIKGTLNYAQRDGLLKFIELARNDGHRVMLITLDGQVHVSTDDITKYDTAEDLYKLFLKKYNVTPREKLPELGFSGEAYEEFLKTLKNLKFMHPVSQVHFTDAGLSTGDDFDKLSSGNYETQYLITTDGKIFPNLAYVDDDGFVDYLTSIYTDQADFFEKTGIKIKPELFKLFLDSTFKISFSKSIHIFNVTEGEYGVTEQQLKTLNKIMYAFKKYDSKDEAYQDDEGYDNTRPIVQNTLTGVVYSYYPEEGKVYEFDKYESSRLYKGYRPIQSAIVADGLNAIRRKDKTLSDAGFQEYQTDVLGAVDTEQIAKFSKGEYTESQIAAKEGVYDDVVSFAEDEEYEDEISMDWGDLGSMGFVSAKEIKDNPKYDEVKQNAQAMFEPYNPKVVQKGFIFPDGEPGFFDPKDIHAIRSRELAMSVDDYVAGFIYALNGVEITTDEFDFEKREYKSGNFGKYVIRIPRSFNYLQKETLFAFIDRCLKDGQNVELWDRSGNAHINSKELEPEQTAEDMYKLFLKRFNMTPRKPGERVRGRFDAAEYKAFFDYLKPYLVTDFSKIERGAEMRIDTQGNVYLNLPSLATRMPDELKGKIHSQVYGVLERTLFTVVNSTLSFGKYGMNDAQAKRAFEIFKAQSDGRTPFKTYADVQARFPFKPNSVLYDFNRYLSAKTPDAMDDAGFAETKTDLLDAVDSDYVKEVIRTDEEVYEQYKASKPSTDLGVAGFAKPKDVEKTSASKKRADAKKAFDAKIKSDTEKSKRKRITVEGAKGNNLMYFREKYKQVQIDSRLYDFIKATTGKRGIDKWIMERINGKLKGTLSMSDLMYYFSTSEKINDKTFQLLNAHIFKNKFITSFDELNMYVQERSSEYYAVRALLSQTTWGKKLLDLDRIISDEQFEQIKDMLLKDKTVTKTGRTMQDVYNSIVANYYSFKKATLNINEGYLRRLWMRKYDCTIQMGGYVSSLGRWAAILNWAVAHGDVSEGAKSLNQSIGDDIELSDTLRDDSALDAFNALFGEVDKNELAEEMINMLMPGVIRKLRKEVSSTKEFSDKVKSELEHYKEKYANMSEERLKSLYDRLVIAEEEQVKRYKEKYGDKGLSILAAEEEMLREEMKALLSYIDESSVTSGRPYVSRSKSKLYTIKKLLSESDKKRFLKVNSDIVDENLKLKREAYLTNPGEKNTKKLVYKSADELKALEERISKLRSEIDTGAYKSKKAMELKDSYERKIAKLEKKLADALTAKSKAPIVVEIDTTTLHIDADREMPSTLKRLLDTEFTQVAKSKTKYLTNDTDYHIRMNMETFIKKHDAFLATFTQEDVEEIINFYEHSDVLGLTGANASQRYSAIRIYMLTFILKGNRLGQFTLDDADRERVEAMLETIVSKAGMELAAWRKAKKELDPEKVLVQSLAKSNNLEFSEESIQELVQATKALQSAKVGSKDWENASRKVVEAKQKMYTQGVKVLKGRPRSIWDKILKFEQVAMLSGPGTWLRNLTSNVTITASNKLLDKIIAKLPSKKGLKVEQYKIAGTTISADVKKFIDETFKTKLADSDYTMLDLISDGLNKYDTRKFNKNDALDNLTIQIRNAITASIYGDVHSNKLGKKDLQNWYDKVSGFVFKKLSDKKFVDSAALSYFGKILTETNADLSKGIADNTIMKYLCDAFVLASHDYMHKTNIFTALDEVVRNTSKPVYFLYKQFMPFAATGWNWFVEGLRYTPLGLAQSIIKLAKLETTIERIEDSLQKGNKVPDSRFAEYVTKRNIGKGIIGTVGWIIGALLFTFGWARIDEEDDKYKLFVADNIAIDISDVFGTQGVFMGITSMKFFQELFKKDGDWDGVKTAMATTLDYMLMDSIFNDLFNMMRFDASTGDWLLYTPTKILNMLVPQFMKVLSDVAYAYDVEFSESTLGNIERLAVNAIPFLAYAFPKHHDPYTGEVQTTYHAQFVTDLANKLLPFKIYPYKVSDAEKEALRLGIHKTSLTGNYSIDGKEVKLSTKDIELLNTFYGKLNKKSLEQLFGNKMKYRVWNEDKNKYEEKLYGSMTEKQKATVIERIMSNNGGFAKVYILTQNGYKYYASEAEYKTLKSLGISCYKATDKKKGFIKS